MAFDADSYVEASQPWSIKIRGVTYTAQPWSAMHAIAFTAGWEAANTEQEKQALWAGVLQRLFPWQLSYWWEGNPVKLFYSLSSEKQKAAVEDFFGYLGTMFAGRDAGESAPVQPIAIEIPGDARPSRVHLLTLNTSGPGLSTTRRGGRRKTATSRIISSGGTGG